MYTISDRERRGIFLLQAEARLQNDPADADDCRKHGFIIGMIKGIQWCQSGLTNCPVCGKEFNERSDLMTHVCYPSEEGKCYACGYVGKEIWKHAQECNEPRELM